MLYCVVLCVVHAASDCPCLRVHAIVGIREDGERRFCGEQTTDGGETCGGESRQHVHAWLTGHGHGWHGQSEAAVRGGQRSGVAQQKRCRPTSAGCQRIESRLAVTYVARVVEGIGLHRGQRARLFGRRAWRWALGGTT